MRPQNTGKVLVEQRAELNQTCRFCMWTRFPTLFLYDRPRTRSLPSRPYCTIEAT